MVLEGMIVINRPSVERVAAQGKRNIKMTTYPIIKVRENTGRFKYSSVPILYSNQKCKCFYCGKYMKFYSYIPTKPERFDGYTIDHLFPRSLGFTLSGNAVLACRKCNERKGDRPPTPEEIVKAWSLYNQANIQFTAKIILP